MLGNFLVRESPRRLTDVNMWPCGGARDDAAKSAERDACLTQVVDERFTLNTVRMKRDIHRIPMVKMQTVVGFRLSQCGHRQSSAERLRKISFDARRFFQ